MPLIAGLVIIGEKLAMPMQAPETQRGTQAPYWYHRKGDTDTIAPTRLDLGNTRTNKY